MRAVHTGLVGLLLAVGMAAPSGAATRLRGAVDPVRAVEPAESTLSVTPVKPQLGLKKPNRVTRMGYAPPKPVEALPKPGDEAEKANAPLQPGDAAATADKTNSKTAAKSDIVTGSTTKMAEPIEPPDDGTKPARRAPREDDPYAAIGYRMGAFLLKPSIEVDFGYDDNPSRQPASSDGAGFVQLRPRIEIQSEWARHELKGTLEGGYRSFLSGSEDARPTLAGTLDGRLDVSSETTVEGQLRLALDTERIGSDSVPGTALARPITLATGATLGFTQRFGRFALRLRGLVDRNDYEDVALSGGGVLAAADRNLTTFGAALRASYEISPLIRPYIDVSTDTRVYDSTATSGGVKRGSTGYALRAGVETAMTGNLTGEASIGFGGRHYEDSTLQDLSGVLFDSTLVWQATALTSLTLRASSTFNETTTTGSSGSISRTLGAEISHAFRTNLVAKAGLSRTIADFSGASRTDTTSAANLGIEYKLSRTMAVNASYAIERLTSTVPGSDYTANTVLVGLRLQR